MAPSRDHEEHVDHGGDDHAEGVPPRKRGQRGATLCEKIMILKKRGIKLDVEFNQRGQPIGKNGAKMISFIGALTRENIPITIDSWDEVPIAMKAHIWDEVNAAFRIDDLYEPLVLSAASRMFRDFKRRLGKNYMKDEEGNIIKTPPTNLYPWISQESWDEFVKKRLSEDFVALSEANRARALNISCRYRGSRKGYANVERELQLEMAPSSESSELPDVSRALVWKKARLNKEGKIDKEDVQAVVEVIDSLTQQASQGDIKDSGRDDILAKALDLPEHPGRVRGVGWGVTQTVYFQGKRKSCEQLSKEELAKIEKMEKDVASLQSLLKQIAAKETTKDQEMETLRAEVARLSSLVGHSHMEEEVDKRSCNDSVADESPIIPPQGNSKASSASTSMGVSNESIIKAVETNEPPITKQFLQGLPDYMMVLGFYAKKMNEGERIQISMDNIVGVSSTTYVGQAEIYGFLRKNVLKASHVAAYMSCLHSTVLTVKNLTSRYAFLCPCQISPPLGPGSNPKDTVKNRASYISDRLASEGEANKLFLAPYNAGGRWVLFAIYPYANKCYYLDPVLGPVLDDVEELCRRALQQFRSNLKKLPPKLKKITWSSIQAPKLDNYVDSGYYVLRYMWETINSMEYEIPKDYFHQYECRPYNQAEIDHIRNEWCKHVYFNAQADDDE